MICAACGKDISQRSKFCMYCGEKVTQPPPIPVDPPIIYPMEDEGKLLRQCYEIILGKEYMAILGKMAEIDMPRTIKLMQSDVGAAMVGKPTLTPEERNKLLNEILAQLPKSAKVNDIQTPTLKAKAKPVKKSVVK